MAFEQNKISETCKGHAMADRLKGKIALITGAASGLGLAMAKRFISEGARVVFSDINHSGVMAAAVPFGDTALALAHDVTQMATWINVVEHTVGHFGGLHILVNNAGIGGEMGSVEDCSLDNWRKVHAVDLDSVFYGCKVAIPYMADTIKKDGTRGSILNVSSIAGVLAAANMPAYNSAKAAVRHLTKSVALHCAKQAYSITCNSVHPVFIDTPIIDPIGMGMPRDVLVEKLGRQIPLGKIGEPDDVAYAAVYLCSNEAKFVTGSELFIDGGISAQ